MEDNICKSSVKVLSGYINHTRLWRPSRNKACSVGSLSSRNFCPFEIMIIRSELSKRAAWMLKALVMESPFSWCILLIVRDSFGGIFVDCHGSQDNEILDLDDSDQENECLSLRSLEGCQYIAGSLEDYCNRWPCIHGILSDLTKGLHCTCCFLLSEIWRQSSSCTSSALVRIAFDLRDLCQ